MANIVTRVIDAIFGRGESGFTIQLAERLEVHPEDEESIRLLAHHPGFVALTNRLKIQRAALKAKLETQCHTDLREVDSLQNGIKWTGWLNAEVDKAVAKRKEAEAVAPHADEMAQFKQVFALLQGV